MQALALPHADMNLTFLLPQIGHIRHVISNGSIVRDMEPFASMQGAEVVLFEDNCLP